MPRETSPSPIEGVASAASPPFRLGYRPVLDGFRGVAVLLVCIYHLDHIFDLGHGRLKVGYVGVDFFFTLSGFLITALLLQEQAQTGSIHLLRFYARRTLRLAPGLFLMLGATLLLIPLAATHEEIKAIRSGVLHSACYAGNFFVFHRTRPCPPLFHTWSLAVEEHFYFVWPFALACLLRYRVRRSLVVALLLLAIGSAPLCRLALARTVGMTAAGSVLPGRLDGLLGGCLVAFIAFWGRLPQAGWPRAFLQAGAGAAAGALILFGHLAPQWSPFTVYVGYSLIAFASALTVAALISCPPRFVGRLLGSRPLVWTGRISYALYLWHWPVLVVLPGLWKRWLSPFPMDRPAQIATSIALSFLFAALAHHAVERPMLRLKDRWKNIDPVAQPEPTLPEARQAA